MSYVMENDSDNYNSSAQVMPIVGEDEGHVRIIERVIQRPDWRHRLAAFSGNFLEWYVNIEVLSLCLYFL